MTMSNVNRAGTKEYYEAELKRLDKSELPKEVIAKTRTFLNHSQIAENLRYDRLRFHANNLRQFFLGMEKIGFTEKILCPDAEDIENGLHHQKTRKSEKTGDTLSDWYIYGIRVSVKKFYKWLEKGKYVDAVSGLKNFGTVTPKHKPDYIVEQSEVDLLIQACDNARDKAIIALLYDSGIRIGELLNLQIQDIVFNEWGMNVSITLESSQTKNHERVVPVRGDSVGYVKAWINVHPDSFNEKAWLFCGIGHTSNKVDKMTEQMSHPQIYSSFKKIKKRAVKMGLNENKRIHPHKFRHNMATHWAPKLSEPVLEKMMGWGYASRMTRVYLHLNDDAVEDAVLKAHGIKSEKKEDVLRTPHICMNCKTMNPSKNQYCLQCGMPLKVEDAKGLAEMVTKASQTLAEGNLINVEQKEMFNAVSDDADLNIKYLLKILDELGIDKLSALKKLLSA